MFWQSKREGGDPNIMCQISIETMEKVREVKEFRLTIQFDQYNLDMQWTCNAWRVSASIRKPFPVSSLRGGADKSLARPGRKKATATKLGIYSAHSPRSSIHFSAHCSNFCKSLEKKFRTLSVQPGLCGSNDLRVGRKMANFQLFFSVQGTGGSPTGSDLENGAGDQDTGSPSRPVSYGLQVPGELGHCRARTRPPWWPSRSVFPSKCPSIAPAEMSNTPRW